MPTGLGIDFGTSHTVAMVRRPDGRTESLLFDSSPLLPSGVFIDDHGGVLVGRDAWYSARVAPARMEPHPKRCVDDGTVLLGDREWAVSELFAAVFERVRAECEQVLGELPPQVVVTHPAVWGPTRRSVLSEACDRAGFGEVRLVPEPVAAADYFVRRRGYEVPPGASIVVYDFGGGTFDASVVTRDPDGFSVTSLDGLDRLGGIDIDAAISAELSGRIGSPADWTWLTEPRTVGERRGRHGFVEDVRLAKERLTRHSSADLYVPVLDRDVHLTRSELEELAAPFVARSVRVVQAVIRDAKVAAGDLAGVFLVGGASRMPLVATMLHRELGVAPIVVDQLEQVVAHGALFAEPMAAPSIPESAPTSEPAPTAIVGADTQPTAGPPTHEQPTDTLPTHKLSTAATPPIANTSEPAVEAPQTPTKPQKPPTVTNGRFGLSRRALLVGGLVVAGSAAVPATLLLNGDEAPADPGDSSPQPLTWKSEPFANGLNDVGGIAFHPDGRLAVSVDGGVELWNPNGTLAATWSQPRRSDRLAFSTDGRRLVGYGPEEVFVWDADDGRILGEFGAELEAAAISPDGAWLAYEHDEQVLIWDISAEREVRTLEIGSSVYGLAFSPDAALLAVGWAGVPMNGEAVMDLDDYYLVRQVKVWDTATGQPVVTLDYSEVVVGPVEFSRDGSLLAAGGWAIGGGVVDVWNVDGWDRLSTLDAGSLTESIAFSPDGTVLAASSSVARGSEWESIDLWNPLTGEHLDSLTNEDDEVRGIAFGPEGDVIACAFERSIVLWRAG